jgi:uncharacterized protein DUF4159
MRTKIVVLVLAARLTAVSAVGAERRDEDRPRGGRVGWARLKNSSGHWKRHARSDFVLSDFIRAHTSLNMDPTWFAADPAYIESLAAYPVIFTNTIATVRDETHRRNLGEYLKRGGFLIVDGCVNTSVTPNPDRFLAENRETLLALVPGGTVRELPREHDLYTSYFNLRLRPVHTQRAPYKQDWIRHGLYGVWDRHHRMVAVLGVSGFQCGWDGFGDPGCDLEAMKTIVNIYVYAMTRSSER